ncbi:unnamed protein product [Diamesa tonsa]
MDHQSTDNNVKPRSNKIIKVKSVKPANAIDIPARISCKIEEMLLFNTNEAFRGQCLKLLNAKNGNEAGLNIKRLVTKLKVKDS